MEHEWFRSHDYTGFLFGNLKKSDHFQDTGVDGRVILILIFGVAG
jgi:hypothetical protein